MQKMTPKSSDKKVELLLPVGSKEMALAAIHNGADAVFFGVPGFNARGRSTDFDMETLKDILSLCRSYRVKVNLAFNILIFQEELEAVVKLLKEILPLQPDALIVQDLGLVQLIRKMSPKQRIHASTQMTVTNYEAIECLQDLNIQRFVLGRENSLDEIKKIREKTNKEIEVFVHGALCVSYSGQCFTSESIGGRSANRGQCAQSCRFSYELYVDGEKRDLGNRKYLVSPQDLCGLDEVPELVESGVSCFKIEGRLKTPEYVATSAQAYRQALDHVQSHFVLHSKTSSPSLPSLSSTEELKKNMSVSYSRGFYPGWLHGVNHQKLVNGQYSSHRGYEIGTVVSTFKNSMTLRIQDPQVYQNLVPGDGLLWVKDSIEQGGFIYGIDRLPHSQLRLEFSRDTLLGPDLEGAKVFQNHDKELKKTVAQSVEDKEKKKRLDISVKISFENGQPLQAQITDGEWVVEGSTSVPASPALNKGVSDELITEEFSSLTGSLFKLQDIQIIRPSLSQELFIPHREIKKLRQHLISELTTKRTQLTSLPIQSDLENWLYSNTASESSAHELGLESKEIFAAPMTVSHTTNHDLKFNILLREKGQVTDLVTALQQGKLDRALIDTVILDFEFGRDYQTSLQELRSVSLRVGLATTRILKPNEYRNIKHLVDLAPDVILVRNLGALHYLTQEPSDKKASSNEGIAKANATSPIELRGDFSLNVSNHLTASYLFTKGLSSLTLSYDLNHQQISKLLAHSQPQKLEVTLFQYMPSFHMEHCVFAAFLSQGSSYRDCGKPCEKHEVKLKDQFQNWHHIKADQECRNTMYNAKSQSAARYLKEWKDQGLGAIRYEALKERGEELISKIKAHMELIQNQITSEELIQKIGSIESYGINEGAIGRSKEYQSRKKL